MNLPGEPTILSVKLYQMEEMVGYPMRMTMTATAGRTSSSPSHASLETAGFPLPEPEPRLRPVVPPALRAVPRRGEPAGPAGAGAPAGAAALLVLACMLIVNRLA